MNHSESGQQTRWAALKTQIGVWASELGFLQMRVANIPLSGAAERLAYLERWLSQGQQGEMAYLAREPEKRFDPRLWQPDTTRVLCFAMPYDTGQATSPARDAPDGPGGWRTQAWTRLEDKGAAVVSFYARGRDYHKVMRKTLARLAERIETELAEHPVNGSHGQDSFVFSARACVDSAPLAEVAWAQSAGLGWRGKHTLLLNRSGSFFFLGELLTNIPLPVDEWTTAHCGSCERCLDVCPTRAITAPYQLDARRCISYLTIEHRSSIPLALRPSIGNRIFGCDDCQLICPWNRFATSVALPDFAPRHGLGRASLLELWAWSEQDFAERTQGSAIRRITYAMWLRNLAVALGNQRAATQIQAQRDQIDHALAQRRNHPDAMVREHVAWAMQQGL